MADWAGLPVHIPVSLVLTSFLTLSGHPRCRSEVSIRVWGESAGIRRAGRPSLLWRQLRAAAVLCRPRAGEGEDGRRGGFRKPREEDGRVGALSWQERSVGLDGACEVGLLGVANTIPRLSRV